MRFVSALLVLLGLAALVWGTIGMMAERGGGPADAATTTPGPEAVVEPPAAIVAAPPPPPPPAPEDLQDPPVETQISVEPPSVAPSLTDGDMSAPEEAEASPPADSVAQPERTRTQNLAEQLTRVPIAYEAPQSARMGEVFEVSLAIDATGALSATTALPGREAVTEATAQVSDRVMASLTGAAFTVNALSPEVQTLSPLTANTWRWQVTPSLGGTQDLVLEIYALIDADTLPVRTFRSPVSVEVSTVRQLVQAAEGVNPLIAIIGGIGSLLGGLFGMARFFRKT